MTLALICRNCGHKLQLTAKEIREGTWRTKRCPVCGDGPGTDRRATEAQKRAVVA